MPSQLARTHLTAQERLRALVTRGVMLRWQQLPRYDEENIDPFVSSVVPLVLAAQTRSVLLTDAYLARALDRRPIGVDVGAVIASLRGDTTPAQVYRRPFVSVWTALSKGEPIERAAAAGLARATGTAAMDVQMAHRGALQAVQDRDPRIRGYQRVANAGACQFCSMINGAVVKSADAMALHNNCGCGLEPIEHEPPVPSLPEGVAVHEHGELGPVLGDPSHDFTAASDLS